MLRPLTYHLKGGPKTLEWTTTAQEAFQNTKSLLAQVIPLQHPAPKAELYLATDVSNTHISSIMRRNWGTDHKPLVTALSRVSAPISPRQQFHLAFISKFNVQMSYLPGLKNVIVPHTPPPHRSHLEPSPPRPRQIQLTSKPCPQRKIAVQKSNVFLAVHSSKLCFGKQAVKAWLVALQVFFT